MPVTAPTDRAPGPLVIARVVVGLELLGAVLLAGAGGVYAVAAAASDRAARAAGTTTGWEGLGVALGVVALAIGVVVLLVLGFPLVMMRSHSAARRRAGRNQLAVGHWLLVALPVLATGRFGTGPGGALAPVAFFAVAAAVTACLFAPSTSEWVTRYSGPPTG